MAVTTDVKNAKFPRNEYVDIMVRTFGMGETRYVEIREFIKDTEMAGHGIIIPESQIPDLIVALNRVSR